MKRMKSPMPTPMACFSEVGMAFMIASRAANRAGQELALALHGPCR